MGSLVGLKKAEERISELEGDNFPKLKSKKKKRPTNQPTNNNNKKKQSIEELWNNYKNYKICIKKILDKKEKNGNNICRNND